MEPQKTSRHIKETPLPHLPQEIIEKILVRLPVKSLLRLKCVSKTWCALISSNGFIKAHLEKSSNNKSFEHHRIILENSIVQVNQCFLPSFSDEPLATAINFDYPTCGPNYGPCYIIGSCNGVVCIEKTAEDYILWNPSTRKFKQLHHILDDNERGVYCAVPCALGFGFDEANDDYKVFRMSMDNESDDFGRKGLVKVYSLKTDSWRKVGVFPLDSPFVGLGIYASGKLYWNRYDSDWVVRGIVSFDLENEIFGSVELPNGVKEEFFFAHTTIDGCLCCICPNYSKPENHVDYWLLKGYGESDSWHKFANLERPLRDGGYYSYHVPFFVGAGGDILCWDREYAVYTVLFKKEDGFSGSDVHDLFTRFAPASYFESLVGL